MSDVLTARVEDWIAADPDEADRATLRALLDSNDTAELERRFAAPLTFAAQPIHSVTSPSR